MTRFVTTESEAAELLLRLVAIPSIAPGVEDGVGEGAMADAVEAFARERGALVERQEVFSGRSNVICTLPGEPGTPTLMFEAHMDTVALGPMRRGHRPWVDDDGRLHGRGACDTKGSLAAMLLAFDWAAAQADRPCALTLVASVDEEAGGSGVKRLVASGVTADAAVVGEPTSLEVVRAHRGGTFWRIRTLGTAAHSSMPQRGDNAIFRMTDLVRVLRREFERRLQGRVHPLVGPSTFSAGAIHAGTSVNMVPDRCDLVFERRSLPGEAIDDIERELFDVIELARAEHAGLRVEVERSEVVAEPLDTPEDAAIVRAVRAAAEAVVGDSVVTGAPYGSDGGVLAEAGIPSVLCGPGDIAYAHSADEWVPAAELVQAAEIYAETWRRFPEILAAG